MSNDSDRLAQGRAVREEVLGTEHVARSLANATEFSRPMQDFVMEYCWGFIWTRPGLDRRTRSLINIAVLSAANRPHELELHVGGALRNGCTPEEIREVLLQVGVYCGVPTALDGTAVVNRVLAQQMPDA